MAEGFGYGQQTPTDSGSEFNVMAFIVRQMMARMSTTKLVKVVAVHGGGFGAIPPTVDVLPLVSQVDGFNNVVPHGTVYGLPVMRPQGGPNAIVIDPVADDVGFVVCADRDSSAAVADPGKAVTPGSSRKFDLADGIYVGGVLNKKPVQYILLDGDRIKIVDKTGNVVEMSAAGIEFTPKIGLPVKVNGILIVTGNLLLGGLIQSNVGGTYAGNIITSGNIISTLGQIVATGVGLASHTHTQPNDSHGDVEQPTSTGTG